MFGTTLNGLAIRITAGSGRVEWETRYGEPLEPAEATVRASNPREKTVIQCIQKAPAHFPPSLETSFFPFSPSLYLTLRSFGTIHYIPSCRQATANGFHMLPTDR